MIAVALWAAMVAAPQAPDCQPPPQFLVDEVRQSADQIRKLASQMKAPLQGVERIKVTPWPEPAASAQAGLLNISLSAVGRCSSNAVPGLCEAAGGATGSPSVVCDSNQLLALVGRRNDFETAPSPALFFVLAHELGHIAHRHAGAFGDGGLTISTASPIKVKIDDLHDKLCDHTDDSLRLENEADAWARAALLAALDSDRFAANTLGAQGARFSAAGYMRGAASRMDDGTSNGSSPLWTQDQLRTLDAPAADVDAAVLYARCTLLIAGTGRVLVPELGASHPTFADRMRAISAEFDSAPATRKADDSSPMTAAGNIGDLLAVAARSSADTDEELAKFVGRFAEAFCSSLQAPVPDKKTCDAAKRGWRKLIKPSAVH